MMMIYDDDDDDGGDFVNVDSANHDSGDGGGSANLMTVIPLI
jgi:hypothetical protein